MDSQLVIVDEYIKKVGQLCMIRGETLENIIKEYLNILQNINTSAIVEGEVAEALKGYIECVQMLENKIFEISQEIKGICNGFIDNIDTADEYIF